MKYMLLIYTSPEPPELPAEEAEAEMGKWYAYSAALAASGALIAGDPLEGPSSATTLQVRDGKRLVTDGPFAETKEAVGGFDLIEAASMDEAVEIAAAHPIAAFGTIEVRPLWGQGTDVEGEPGR